MGSYVGIDLHRRRSVVVVLNEDGDRVSWESDRQHAANLAGEIVAAGGAGGGRGDGGDVGLVLGGRRDRRMRGPATSGPSVGDRRLRQPAGEERHPRRNAAR